MTDNSFVERLWRIRHNIELPDSFSIRIGSDGERLFFQVVACARDVVTGNLSFQTGHKAYLSEHATDSELIQTIFGLYLSFVEHEARETFLYRGRRVFGPHISTDALWEIAERTDARPQRTAGAA